MTLHIQRWGISFQIEYSISYNPAPDDPVEFDLFNVKVNGVDITNIIDPSCYEKLYESAIDKLPDGAWADMQPEEEMA